MQIQQLSVWANSLLPKLTFFGIVVLLDLLGGVLLAWRSGTFKWAELPKFMQKASGWLFSWLAFELLGFLPGLLAINIPGLASVTLGYTGDAVYAGALIKYVADVLGHVSALGVASQSLGKLGIDIK